MNTNTTLTERDKKLLLGLAYVVIAFVFIWCLIRPLCKKIIEVHEDILVASSLRSANETNFVRFTRDAGNFFFAGRIAVDKAIIGKILV